MSILDSIKTTVLVPVHREGYPFIGIAAVGTLILIWLGAWLAWPMLALTVWVVFFFRDPVRVTPVREGLVIAPADGRVSLVSLAVPPLELGLGEAPVPRVSIFMSVFDCHVNRAPISGKITAMAYRPGKFLNADLDKASEDNERNELAIESAYGKFGVVQIAGLVARRIVWWVDTGHQIGVGERFGMIRFGSRVDVYFPEGAKPLVAVGQKSVAGETVLADMTSREESRLVRVG
ncbi:phosphatidylserine decarboxylase [Phreatobacter sp. AB_2022a]|uniref:phosphatidylserine decarboxylase n=1 Tax=Phreatobacter sp. AB_2022a TaxID=3003134 RepID=UPI0022876632|nr:phosphatidylserine decarboxylase [Phreatobacter sp. AB_2022a]MCZ0737099.1 phosphatidylserine decarboxylase [Phreatobacter sp. AB_2022a]